MNVPTKLAAFSVLLVAVFVAALGVGTAVGPVDLKSTSSDTAVDRPIIDPWGLGISQDGYTLAPDDSLFAARKDVPYRFSIKGPDGQSVTEFVEAGDNEMHLTVVRRDMSGFEYLLPVGLASGVWRANLDLSVPGSYRVIADFTPAASGERVVLGTDLEVAGDSQPKPLPQPSRKVEVDGYTVTLTGELVAGWESILGFAVEKDGKPVTDLSPRLGGYGHLVALRAGDLAYLDVRPTLDPKDDSITPGPNLFFTIEVPSRGNYRLYLEFLHEGEVHSAEFTFVPIVVPTESSSPSSPTTPTTPPMGHGH